VTLKELRLIHRLLAGGRLEKGGKKEGGMELAGRREGKG